MGDVIKVNRVDKQDSNTDVKKINNGIGDSVYECMKMLANKSKVSSYSLFHLFGGITVLFQTDLGRFLYRHVYINLGLYSLSNENTFIYIFL